MDENNSGLNQNPMNQDVNASNDVKEHMQEENANVTAFEDVQEQGISTQAPQESSHHQHQFHQSENGGAAPEPCYYERVKEPQKKKNGNSWKKFIAACVIVSFVGGGTMGISLGLTQKYIDSRYNTQGAKQTEEAQTATVKKAVSKSSGNKSTVDIIKEVKPSVVSISTKAESVMSSFGGFARIPYEQQGAGSGVIFYEDNDKIGIATNNHVIEGANDITVTFDEDKSVKASIAGTDSMADLAVLTISRADLNAAGITDIRVATFGDSDAMEEGETVIAIGNALGEGITVTDGIVSATGKTINVDGKVLQVIQTNAAINDGNSGGALVNEDAQVIGINTAKASEFTVEGMGYAIPSNVIAPIIEKLLVEGTAPKPYIGIRGVDITDEISQLYRLKLPVGVLVVEVIPGGSAEKAGLKPNDIITGIDGKNVISMDQLVEVLANQTVGNTVSIDIVRDGQTPMELQITILDANQQDIQ